MCTEKSNGGPFVTFRKKENWGIDPVHYLLRLASECESGEWKPDLEVK